MITPIGLNYHTSYRREVRSKSFCDVMANPEQVFAWQTLDSHGPATGTSSPELDRAGTRTINVMDINTTPPPARHTGTYVWL